MSESRSLAFTRRLAHWLNAALVIVALAMGALMVLAVQNAATRFDLTQTHKSIGVSVLVLTLLRLGMRCFFRAPKLEPTARSVVGRGRARRPAHICSQLRRPLIGQYLDIAGAILAAPHRAVDGTVTAKGPGFGLEWDESAIARFTAEPN
jgi:hypothetical protein